MKHALRDLVIGILDVSAVLTYRMLRLRAQSPLVRILVFHDVPDLMWFRGVLEYLKNETTVLTPEQFHKKQFNARDINVLLTFDDGYASWVDVALPLLDRYGYSGIFFLNSGLLDAASDESASVRFFKERLLVSPKRSLSWEGARTIASRGHTIGGHTVSHPVLSQISYDAAIHEIKEDKERIESELSVTLTDFAYPFGTSVSISPEAILAAKDAGYMHAYSAESDFVGTSHDQYMIPRMCLEKAQSVKSIDSWMRGGFDLFSKMKHSV